MRVGGRVGDTLRAGRRAAGRRGRAHPHGSGRRRRRRSGELRLRARRHALRRRDQGGHPVLSGRAARGVPGQQHAARDGGAELSGSGSARCFRPGAGAARGARRSAHARLRVRAHSAQRVCGARRRGAGSAALGERETASAGDSGGGHRSGGMVRPGRPHPLHERGAAAVARLGPGRIAGGAAHRGVSHAMGAPAHPRCRHSHRGEPRHVGRRDGGDRHRRRAQADVAADHGASRRRRGRVSVHDHARSHRAEARRGGAARARGRPADGPAGRAKWEAGNATCTATA